MKTLSELSVEISEKYNFDSTSLDRIQQNRWVKAQWPLVYFIENDSSKIAYIGESTNALSRIKTHLSNPDRLILNKISFIGSDKFNKSATMDIESNLIQYLLADETYQLQNGNLGLVNHNYYQQDVYRSIFQEIWNKLLKRQIVTKSLSEIENSELFKYSPYKSLNEDQYNSVLSILEALTSENSSRIFVSGSAGTGKTILATYLIKLLTTKYSDNNTEEYNEDELKELTYIRKFQQKYPNARIALVVAMSSLRESLQNVFRKVPGLKASMVISPADTLKNNDLYDLLIVDESHRLRKYKNISWMKSFRDNNRKLGLTDEGTELDWIIAKSKNQLFFYDQEQTVKPSDVDTTKFTLLLNNSNTIKLQLESQMRVKGGTNYIQFVDELLHVRRKESEFFEIQNYELLVFDSFRELCSELEKKESRFGLSRMIAGYSWPWLSKKNAAAYDIEIEGIKFRWNSTDKDWVNSPNAFNEIGCIHTTQGYDLNYAAIIFGREINYNSQNDCIEIDASKYFDINGKKGVSNPDLLKSYIINIYKTLMYRGIKGTFLYACNKELSEYLKRHIKTYEGLNEFPFRIIHLSDVNPYVNSIPLVDITAAAGDFSGLQNSSPSDFTWIAPLDFVPREGYFVCKVNGDSMNKKIPNGAYCLFSSDNGGTREGEIVLVQSTNINDSEFGSGYTVKEYHSSKNQSPEGWNHNSISLVPLSNNPDYKPIELSEDASIDFKVIGIFQRILFP